MLHKTDRHTVNIRQDIIIGAAKEEDRRGGSFVIIFRVAGQEEVVAGRKHILIN